MKISIPEKLRGESSVGLTIYNLFGEKILEQDNLPASATIDLKALSNGVYFYEIVTKETINRNIQTYRWKFVKE